MSRYEEEKLRKECGKTVKCGGGLSLITHDGSSYGLGLVEEKGKEQKN
jgi:hypothetical protein